jgi:MarR family transcriptional regulator, organic hydroperoxide resistance regulator
MARARDIDRIVETVIYLQTEGRRLAREECQRLGITATQLNVLKLLEEIGDLSLSELSKRIASQNSTVTGIVDRMVDAGLVQRERDDDDRRVWRIRMTAKGTRLARSVTVAPWDILHQAVDGLPAGEKQELIRLLDKVAAHVNQLIGDKT